MAYAEPTTREAIEPSVFERMFDMALDLLAIASAEGRFIAVNASWGRALGWSREELTGRPLIEFVHPADREATLAVMARASQAGFELVAFENRYRCRDGSYRWLSWRASTDGSSWYAVARDITERKEQETQQLELVARMRSVVTQRTSELRSVNGALEVAETEIVRRLSMAVEWRDDDTGHHIDRVGRYSGLLAQRAGLDPGLWEPIRFASPLHDAGKVAIPDAILLKPGRLTPEERRIMETHAQSGYELLRGSASPVLELAATIAGTHHEKYDGSGYPRGLAGEDIPIAGRIVAIVDVFDALTSDRVYR
ncbi:MAG: PAS domain S-box protein, partial [Actinomycetota bacterium]|nr:PAS domain S-box protein [Actinomycetota bacterium]